MFRRAVKGDIKAVARIYDHIHEEELGSGGCTGWVKNIYPVEATAKAAFERGDLFVCDGNGNYVQASAIINQIQVDAYARGQWEYPAPDNEIMVLHTLVVDPAARGRGLGPSFVRFYESYALECGCHYLRIDTNARNARARAMYAKLGYKEIGIVPCNFNGIPNVKLVLMEKKLEQVKRRA